MGPRREPALDARAASGARSSLPAAFVWTTPASHHSAAQLDPARSRRYRARGLDGMMCPVKIIPAPQSHVSRYLSRATGWFHTPSFHAFPGFRKEKKMAHSWEASPLEEKWCARLLQTRSLAERAVGSVVSVSHESASP